MQIVHTADGLAIKRHNQVALAEPGTFGGTVLLDRDDKDTGFERQVIKSNHAPMQWHILTSNTNMATPDSSIANQPPGDQSGCVAANRKADPLRRANHCRVDANHFSRGVNERSAGVPRVQRRVSLDNVVD